MNETFERLRAALADRYALSRELGAGGMATVYLAEDLRHRRHVALKVVRPEFGGPQGIERFLREIELAARLQHPHILPVFDSGVVEDGGAPMPYFVMPFVEGETLRQRLERERQLSPADAAALAGEVADALAYAHAHGVVHRDIKPENILLSGGHAVVADFGVAKAIESGTMAGAPAADSRLTVAGFALGTPQYMSPEQATGRDAVDARSDQYSLGCVLYEMLAGRPPFEGPTAQAIIAKTMTAPRPRPPAFEPVITRAMATDPDQRFPDMKGFAAALREQSAVPASRGRRGWLQPALALALVAGGAGLWLATRDAGGTVAAGAETMAVLPFNASGPGVELLGEGMVDLLGTNLNGVGGIRTVDPRSVVRRWERKEDAGGDPMEHALDVGRDLGARSVVVGSVVSAGGRVRLAANLYSVGGEQLGRAQVDGPVDSVLSLVDRLSLALLRDVWRSREPLPTVQLASVTTDSLAALRAYLRGERHYRRLSFDSALASFSRAVEVDSTFALAHFRRALAYGWTGGYGSEGSREAAAAGLRFAERLPARDRRLLAHYRLFERGRPASVDSLSAFVAEHPEDLEARYLLGEALYHTRPYTGASADSVVAAFEAVLRRDSSLVPAALHPLELAFHYGDRRRYHRYAAQVEADAPSHHLTTLRALAGIVWGPPPSDSAYRVAWRTNPGWLIASLHAAYHQTPTSSDSVLRRFRRAADLSPPSKNGTILAMQARGMALAGFGRMRESRALAESLAVLSADAARGVLGFPAALGLYPPESSLTDSVIGAMPVGADRAYAEAIRAVLRNDPETARRTVAAALADTTGSADLWRGLLVATEGWAAMVAGDSVAGLERMRAGLELAAAPGVDDETAFMRFQLALALASREGSRDEGIRRLRNSFDSQALYLPLGFLALGRAWEAAGQSDSAAYAYGQFIQLWDRADPDQRWRVEQAREALQRLTAEPRR